MARVTTPPKDMLFEKLRSYESRLAGLERRVRGPGSSASVFSTQSQAIGNDVFPWIALVFGEAEFDPEEMWNGSDRITFARAGLYLCGLEAEWSIETSGFREARIHHRLVAQATDAFKGPSISTGAARWNHLVAPLVAEEGDFVRVVVYQQSGVQLQVLDPARLWFTRIA